ncbi:MAG: serine protease [Planctomycetales bacterium]|nr:serine protease [Planctomycetales bacterium]
MRYTVCNQSAAVLLALLTLALAGPSAAQSTFAEVVSEVQPKIAKIYGAGGLRGLEAYQSGFLISAEGHVLTAWSYVLDTDYITVTLDDGRKFQGELLGADPRLEIAIVKVDATDLPHFNVAEGVELDAGDRVLAFSNLYGVASGDEPASVLHGHVSARWSLAARRGVFETPYRGDVYVLDAMTNNPGAAGGALTDRQGQFVGILGKELKNAQNNTWLNYCLPAKELAEAVSDILAGKVRRRDDPDEEIVKPVSPHSLSDLGIFLVPDVLPKTPPFVDRIRIGSPAERAGLRVDDLILFVGPNIVGSCKGLRNELTFVDRIDELRLTVQRDQELQEVVLTLTPEE